MDDKAYNNIEESSVITCWSGYIFEKNGTMAINGIVYNDIEPVCNLSEIEKVEKIEDIEEENKGYLYLQECAGCAEFEVEEVVSLVPWAEKEDK